MIKKITPILFAFLFIAIISKAQTTSGLIAHWDMNGETNDISGNGHNGTPSNVISGVGINGIPNTAYYFNGINSVITAPYLPDLNLTSYSICAIIKVEGFYSGLCQQNNIFTRGPEHGHQTYSLVFGDNLFDSSCTEVDSFEDRFAAFLGTNGAAYLHNWVGAYPPVQKDIWYKLVMTFNGTQWKLYINDTFRLTVVSAAGSAGVPGTDSISIGKSIFDGSTYPQPFKGFIDDIKLYNRVLADSEISHVNDTCGTITLQPVADTLSGGVAEYIVSSTINSPNYQWQQDAGTGYVNLSDAGPFSGVTTDSLKISGGTTALNNYHYRCIVSNSVGCADTSSFGPLYATTGMANMVLQNAILLYPIPAENNIFIDIPANYTTGKISFIDEIGRVLKEQTIQTKQIPINITDLKSGVYVVRVEVDGQVVYRKVEKQ